MDEPRSVDARRRFLPGTVPALERILKFGGSIIGGSFDSMM